MTYGENRLRERFRQEADRTLFVQMELNDEIRQSIRRQAAAMKSARRSAFKRKWLTGAAALAAAVIIVSGISIVQHPATPTPAEQSADGSSPANTGDAGSELSSLTSTTLGSVDEAKAAFGSGLLVPTAVPNGFTISEIVAAGVKGEPARDVIFTYASGDKSFTFVASRMEAAFPTDLFTATKVGGEDGFVFEQPELIELYWVKEGVQYSVVGQLSAEEAIKVAESAQR